MGGWGGGGRGGGGHAAAPLAAAPALQSAATTPTASRRHAGAGGGKGVGDTTGGGPGSLAGSAVTGGWAGEEEAGGVAAGGAGALPPRGPRTASRVEGGGSLTRLRAPLPSPELEVRQANGAIQKGPIRAPMQLSQSGLVMQVEGTYLCTLGRNIFIVCIFVEEVLTFDILQKMH